MNPSIPKTELIRKMVGYVDARITGNRDLIAFADQDLAALLNQLPDQLATKPADEPNAVPTAAA